MIRADGPEVSIVIPTYNEGDWLKQTVRSIRGARADLRYEILIVDDGCSDGSVQSIANENGVTIISTAGQQRGLILGKNLGAKAAKGRYLCFLDSHVLVHDYWLDCLRETCDAYPQGGLISGNLQDAAHYAGPTTLDRTQRAYTIQNCSLSTGWHRYSQYTDKSYMAPLTPGGLMFVDKLHFEQLGGFASALRKWGVEDVEISLHNYYVGGENVVDPRVIVYHHFKRGEDRTYTVNPGHYAFNCLYTAYIYFPYELYIKIRKTLLEPGTVPKDEATLHRRLPQLHISQRFRNWLAGFAANQIESKERRQVVAQMQSTFVRRFEDWVVQFSSELGGFLKDAELRPGL